MRLTKIYTKVGDKGTTLLASGERVSKASPRIEAYGTVDELNAVVGMLRDVLQERVSQTKTARCDDIHARLLVIQNELFDLGGELSTPAKVLNAARQSVVSAASIARLEAEMDEMNEHLPPLENFVLPGGHLANSVAHLARTVCRRAERCVVSLAEIEDVRDDARVYLNRLSDWLFVICREVSFRFKVPETLWQQKKS